MYYQINVSHFRVPLFKTAPDSITNELALKRVMEVFDVTLPYESGFDITVTCFEGDSVTLKRKELKSVLKNGNAVDLANAFKKKK